MHNQEPALSLLAAIQANDIVLVSNLLTANPTLISTPLIPRTGSQAIHVATGHPEILRLLIDKFHADVNARSSDGSTALLFACMAGDVQAEAVQILCERGCDLYLTDEDGDGPLYYAATGKAVAVQCIAVLRKFGVKGDPMDPTHTSSGVIHVGCSCSH
ncbi:ankyrin [Rhizoclosmatium globosum]|uniref:Ankyrin n=1 Tax=Rhizoclosmatium globosum TaxID=329046 RepID=A0A1Y2AMG5_9FUNG|nr:hypothetical protein HDU79_004814 [Rhizoclosmatium sp. JEL0117]ORY23779.1 ankyrin [Rhizoclosmatium globosum]|eukprot:ORY23779.1 ankyrin [Rhizoclosmatium globosum]